MLSKQFILKDKKLIRLYAGEVYITRKRGVVITTLLGSCVSVCLSDNTNSVFGINHFMLPQNRGKEDNIYKYAITAIDELIRLMIRRGANINLFEAKVFGGAFVAKTGFSSIPEMNIKMAIECLSKYGIEIKAKDIGGVQGRQIYFCTGDQIYTRKIKGSGSTNKGKVGLAL